METAHCSRDCCLSLMRRIIRHLSTDTLIRKRALETIDATDPSLSYSPVSGQWTTTTLRDSCRTQVESTISFNSSVSFTFVGTSLSVNIVKNSNGAPYNVTFDGEVHQYDSFASSNQCTADFQASNLAASQHTVVVSHNGNSALAGTGRYSLQFASFEYESTGSVGGSSKAPVGAIVGGVVAGIAVILIGGFLWWFFRRRKARIQGNKEEAVQEPYQDTSTYVIPHQHDQDGRPSVSSRQEQGMYVQPPQRSKGAEAANNSRYVRNSPWASLTSNNPSRPNVAGSESERLDSSNSATESIQPTSPTHSQYPPSTEISSDSSRVPGVIRPLIPQTTQRRYAPAPSTVGESVLIDDPDYVAPPSYSPPPSNHPGQSMHQALQEKAIYEGQEDSSGSSTNWLSPVSSRRPLPGAPMSSSSHGPAQALSQSDIDVIARRVADIMRSTPSNTATGSRFSEVSSSDVANPQVQQAVRALLERDEEPQNQSGTKPPNS